MRLHYRSGRRNCKGTEIGSRNSSVITLTHLCLFASPQLCSGSMRSGSPQHLGNGDSEKWDTAGVLLDDGIMKEPGTIDLPAVFGNDRPVEIEIGTGKGTFLLARAAERPDLNFLGIEWARAYALYSADRFKRHGLENVRMLRVDAAEFFHKKLANKSIWRLHIYFPDPWPKTRHHRRRLIQGRFIEEARRVLKLGGQLVIVTDHKGYFSQVNAVMQSAKGFATVPFPRLGGGKDGELVGTNFERKYIAQGRPFYWLARMRYR